MPFKSANIPKRCINRSALGISWPNNNNLLVWCLVRKKHARNLSTCLPFGVPGFQAVFNTLLATQLKVERGFVEMSVVIYMSGQFIDSYDS